ncbi:cob(I)yrinic acid a,c-diamide adenosyltransferase [Thiohalomonas denitrificans]|uniref:Corrinoid adenosyltransferase n=1 Tax=Thiohalomonas denitrificans TaxID=415747 RepID=A0A1G5PNE9_9GAMM|nr:cob(I)yrinic acid a,c-diamide adenosyltransferase [Thiohalomonas denitrificans]SCZ50741.1 cob(I)alamin adenosyltransferase [Thiohalomonas denitrificans]
MGYRLTKIYTRTGDKGTTSLGDGNRIDKDAPRMEAIGTVDELNSLLGMVLAHPIPKPVRDSLSLVQNDLFDLGGELSVPGRDVFTQHYVERLEKDIDALNAELPPLENFILPGGGQAAATCHLVRAVCRRAERTLITLTRQEALPAPLIAYLNRLSDLLFVAARILGRADKGEVLWQPGKGS